ncbi:MAG: hypothetical protein HY891_00735 [Deltaproteobacteria bacterium]|nr:hypothetical protein [Deltaproteobacteria bacterium]
MKIRLEVGEPKNFNAGDGTNAIIATVVEGLEGSRAIEKEQIERFVQVPGREQKIEGIKEYWFVANCNPVAFDDMHFSSILLIPRYRTKRSPLEHLRDGEKLVLNGVWKQDGKEWDKDSVSAAINGTIEISGMIAASVKIVEE